jgi:ubiquinone/menaquinone biosynthesis C-methylase UbiE
MQFSVTASHGSTDPFGGVDGSSDPAFEERILLNRISTAYYAKTLDWFFDSILRDIAPASVLEVGCGTGHVLHRCYEALARRPARTVGVDLSRFLVERAAERFPAYEFHVADGGALPFDSGSFDLVYASTVLVHTTDPGGIVREMARVAKPGGKVAVLDQDFETATLYPGDRERTRKILTALTDFWASGWIGRQLPALMTAASLTDIAVDARVRIDRELDQDFFRRIRDWVIEHGVSRQWANAWYDDLVAARPGEFFFSRNFYVAEGIRS